MKNGIKLTGLQILVLAIITSCSKDLVIDNFKSESYSIKSIFFDGKTNSKFIYADNGKIIESQSFYFCNKYIYDDNGRLVRQEVAVDPDIASSSIHIKSVLMTSQNSTFTGNYIFEYEDVPGIDKFSASTTTYEYNDKGFPTMVNKAEEYILVKNPYLWVDAVRYLQA